MRLAPPIQEKQLFNLGPFFNWDVFLLLSCEDFYICISVLMLCIVVRRDTECASRHFTHCCIPVLIETGCLGTLTVGA